MPTTTDVALFKSLKNGEIAPVYFLYGQEGFFLSSAVSRIEQMVVAKNFEEFNLQKFQGEKASMAEIENACESLPVMANHKCVIIKDLDIEKLLKAEFDKLISLITDLPKETVLVIYLMSIPVDSKKSSKIKKLQEAVYQTGGVCCEFSLKDKLTLRRALCEKAKKSYVSMSMEAAGYLIDYSSSNYAILSHEMEKLIAYVGRMGEITEKEIEECCIRTIDSSAFDLAKSILSGNYDRACHLLDELFTMRQEPIAVLGALNMAFSDLYRAASALTAKKTTEQVASDFRYPKNRLFAVKNAFRDSRSFPVSHIRGCVFALYEADQKLKSSRMPDRLVLEEMLGQMMLSTNTVKRKKF